jgi:hypothetical protein
MECNMTDEEIITALVEQLQRGDPECDRSMPASGRLNDPRDPQGLRRPDPPLHVYVREEMRRAIAEARLDWREEMRRVIIEAPPEVREQWRRVNINPNKIDFDEVKHRLQRAKAAAGHARSLLRLGSGLLTQKEVSVIEDVRNGLNRIHLMQRGKVDPIKFKCAKIWVVQMDWFSLGPPRGTGRSGTKLGPFQRGTQLLYQAVTGVLNASVQNACERVLKLRRGTRKQPLRQMHDDDFPPRHRRFPA